MSHPSDLPQDRRRQATPSPLVSGEVGELVRHQLVPTSLDELGPSFEGVATENDGKYLRFYHKGLLAWQAIHTDMTQQEHREKEASLEQLTMIDEKTGLLNSRGLRSAYETLSSSADGQPAAVLFADLDGFKHLNTQYGEVRVDAVLREVARIMWSTLREHDVLARYGGDEFVGLLQQVDTMSQAQEIAERMQDTVRCIRQVGDIHFAPGEELTMSVGLAPFVAGQPFEAVLGEANQLMRSAKANGRDQIIMLDRVA